jgi:hypothetical protein
MTVGTERYHLRQPGGLVSSGTSQERRPCARAGQLVAQCGGNGNIASPVIDYVHLNIVARREGEP